MRFAIIGAGYIGPINAAALMEIPDAQIVAVANRTVEKAQALCSGLHLQCPVYADWEEMLRREKPDAVVLNLFNDLHKACFLACAQRGIHVLLEKPVANTYADCLEMMEAAAKAGIKTSVLQTQRYNAVFVTAKAYIEAHAQQLGELVSVNDNMCCHYFWAQRNPWHLDPVRSGGGIVLNYGVHQLDRIHWFMNQKTVAFHAHYLTKKPGIATYSSYAMMGLGDGGTPYVATCTGNSDPMVNELTLAYQNGTVRCVLSDNGEARFGAYVGDTDSGGFHRLPLLVENGDQNHQMYMRQFTEAVDYLVGRTDVPPVSLQWGSEMVRLCCLGLDMQ